MNAAQVVSTQILIWCQFLQLEHFVNSFFHQTQGDWVSGEVGGGVPSVNLYLSLFLTITLLFINKDRYPNYNVEKCFFVLFSFSLVFGCMKAHSHHENGKKMKS